MTPMTQPLEYATPAAARPSRALAFLAHATLLYPLFLLGALYGQWLLSWLALGHRPQPSLDDPKFINGASWMHGITLWALTGFIPAGCVGAVLNVLYVVDQRFGLRRAFTRVVLLVSLWVGTVFLLRWDPGRVLYWWLD